MPRTLTENVVIANGATNSSSFFLSAATDGSFQLPASFTGTSIQPQQSLDGATFTNVGSAITVVAGGTYQLPTAMFGSRFGRLVSGTAEGAERTIVIGLKK